MVRGGEGGDEEIGREGEGEPAPAGGAVRGIAVGAEGDAVAGVEEVTGGEGGEVVVEGDVEALVRLGEPGGVAELAEDLEGHARGAGAEVLFEGLGELEGGAAVEDADGVAGEGGEAEVEGEGRGEGEGVGRGFQAGVGGGAGHGVTSSSAEVLSSWSRASSVGGVSEGSA